MQRAKIKRISVLSDDGRLPGLVSRRDVLGIFARSDAEIGDEITEHMMAEVLCIDPERVEVVCDDRNVTLIGEVETRSDTQLARGAGRACRRCRLGARPSQLGNRQHPIGDGPAAPQSALAGRTKGIG